MEAFINVYIGENEWEIPCKPEDLTMMIMEAQNAYIDPQIETRTTGEGIFYFYNNKCIGGFNIL